MAGGYLWVVNEGSNSVSRIDPEEGRVVGAPIPVGHDAGGNRGRSRFAVGQQQLERQRHPDQA